MSRTYGIVLKLFTSSIGHQKQGKHHKQKTALKRLNALEQAFKHLCTELKEKYGDVEISPETMSEEDYNRIMDLVNQLKRLKENY